MSAIHFKEDDMSLRSVTNEFKEHTTKFISRYKEELKNVLKEAGIVDNTLVHDTQLNLNGVIKVEPKGFSVYEPFGVNFYPLKKDGTVSKNTRGFFLVFSHDTDEAIISKLKIRYKVIGKYEPKE